MNESEIAHATMGDEEARLRKAVEIARAELDRVKDLNVGPEYDYYGHNERAIANAQETYDDAIFALNDAGYEE